MSSTSPRRAYPIDLFHGPATDASAILYARWRVDNRDGRFRIGGTVKGPYCHSAKTLPASYEWTDQGAGPTALASATLLDACGWSLDLPATYHVALELWEGDQRVGRVDRVTAIRRFGTVGKSFSQEGKRVVLRIGQAAPSANSLATWKTARLARLIEWEELQSDICREALELGVALIVNVASTSVSPARVVAQAADCPAVVAAVLDPKIMESTLHRVAPNLLLGLRIDGERIDGERIDGERIDGERIDGERIDDSTSLPDVGADFLFADCDHCAALANTSSLPLVAFQSALASDPIELRRQCDRLQASLTPLSLAGYAIIRNL